MPSPKRPYNPKAKLISELKKNKINLYKLLKNIIENSNSNQLQKNAKKSISSIEDLIDIIQESTVSEIKEIAKTALKK